MKLASSSPWRRGQADERDCLAASRGGCAPVCLQGAFVALAPLLVGWLALAAAGRAAAGACAAAASSWHFLGARPSRTSLAWACIRTAGNDNPLQTTPLPGCARGRAGPAPLPLRAAQAVNYRVTYRAGVYKLTSRRVTLTLTQGAAGAAGRSRPASRGMARNNSSLWDTPAAAHGRARRRRTRRRHSPQCRETPRPVRSNMRSSPSHAI